MTNEQDLHGRCLHRQALAGERERPYGHGFTGGGEKGPIRPTWTGFSLNPRPMEIPLHVCAGSWLPSARMSDAWASWLMMESMVGPMHRVGSKAPATCLIALVNSPVSRMPPICPPVALL